MFVYLPHLDYCLQKFGPDAEVIEQELEAVDSEIGRIVKAVEDQGLADETVFLVVSEYAMQSVAGDIAVNRVLRNQGLLKVREINGREYLDFELSPAFAMVDHQVAHIYIKEGYEARVRAVLEKTPGIAMVLGHEDQRKYKVRHGNSGDLIIVSARDKWFSYYWWEDRKKEPDFATHVDIHRKPGYDPLELCLDPQSRNISQDTSRIKGSHGYPALAKEDKIPLLVSGALAEDFKLPVGMDSTSVFDLIEKIVLS
jgi:predicted AlkP superfamily pyrophosphatase or phosphodiesterase